MKPGADGLMTSALTGFLGRNRLALGHHGWRLGSRLGDIDQQAAILRLARSGTVVHAGGLRPAGLARLGR